MKEKDLKHILRNDFNFNENWKPVLHLLFNKIDYFSTPSNPFSEEDKVKSGKQTGVIKLDDDKSLAIFEVEVDDSIRIDQNRKGLRDIAAKHIDQNITHGALVFFYSKNQTDYRLSFIAKWSEIDLETGEFIKGETKPKRFTYLLGANESCTTAAKRLLVLAERKLNGKKIDLHTVMDAFSVEPLKKDFFKTYKQHYEKFWRYIAENERYRQFLLDTSKNNNDAQEKPIRDFVKKLLGRIVFLHFLQKKGWMGCPAHTGKWENGDKQFMQNLFDHFQNKENFHSQCLTQLFFNTLNTRRENDIFELNALNGSLNGSRVPYLNGGLFEPDKPGEVLSIDFPVSYFNELFDFFAQYNFTIDENSPDDHEVGIDPEMLGHIFENLLEENREKGAFYTPKEIVEYMSQESAIQYLKNFFPEEAQIENFIRHHQVCDYFTDRDNANALNEKLDAVKVCDPAIGSGAFPIGILHELFEAKKFIYPYLNTHKPFNPAKVKKDIIQNSIYGVDIEKGAVDIAQLRFWLALVVDETEPQPLPNLDYKIMQGNSLLESFEGVDLSKAALFEEPKVTIVQQSLFEEHEEHYGFSEENKANIKQLIKDYFNVEDKEEKSKIHKAIDKIVIEHIDKSLEFYENRLLIEIAEAEQSLKRKLVLKQNTAKVEKEIAKRKKLLENKTQARQKLLEFEKTDERPYFLWHLYFMDVFEQGGFDIMIGNPPYIQLQRDGGILADMYVDSGFETFQRTGDIYALFYEKGIQLLKNGGCLTFITSNKWMRANYGKSLRKFFTNYNPVKLLDLGAGIFDNATVDTNILIIEKTKKPKQNLKAAVIKGKQSIVNLSEDDYSILTHLDENSWVILSPQEQNIKQLIEKAGTTLKDWDIEINYGIKTGLNEAFIINGNKKDELIAADPKSADIIYPMLRGRDIKKYKVEFADLWLINSHNGVRDYEYDGYDEDKKWLIKPIDINEYPAIKNHLDKYWDRLVKRQDKGYTPYNLRNCAYLEAFEKEKIVYNDIAQTLSFALAKEGVFFNNTVYFITHSSNNRYLLAILNSKLIDWFYKRESAQLGNKAVRLFSIYVEKLPIIKTQNTKLFENLVDYILFLKNPANPNLSEKADNEHLSLFFEDVIDGCVFELYFEQHMKEKGINILDLVSEQVQSIEGKNEKETGEIILNTWLKMRHSEITERMRQFTVKSPDILKIILES